MDLALACSQEPTQPLAYTTPPLKVGQGEKRKRIGVISDSGIRKQNPQT